MSADDFADYPAAVPAIAAPPERPRSVALEQGVPHDEDAERAVISACLMDERALVATRRLLQPDHFYREAHRRIYEALGRVADRGARADVLTLADALGDDLPRVGGKDYLSELIDAVPTAANVQHHARLLIACAHRRTIIEATHDAGQLARQAGADSAEIARALTQRLMPLSVDPLQRAGYVRADAYPTLTLIEDRMAGRAGLGMPTGIAQLDAEVGGLQLAELVFIGGVAKVGKSVLAHQIMINHLRYGGAAGIVSAELRRSEIIERILCNVGSVSQRAVRRGAQLSSAQMRALLEAGHWVNNAKLWIDDAARPSYGDIMARTAALKAEHPEVTLIVVDFLQLIRYELKGRQGHEELTALAYGLKDLAKILDVAVIVPCQLNYKDIEKRDDRRPELHDLQGSSGMVQAADLVVLMYRPGMYWPEKGSGMELIVPSGGSRHADGFTANAYWRGDVRQIANVEFDPPPPPAQTSLAV